MKRFLTVLTLLPLAALSACSSDDGGISIDGAWARQSPMGATMGAAYMEIKADEADTLVAASVPAAIAGSVEIHEVVPAEGAMGDSMDDDSMAGSEPMDMPMVMRELDGGLPLPAGETVVLKPGGYHIMLIDVVKPLEVGQKFDLTLQFEKADDLKLTVEVMESAP